MKHEIVIFGYDEYAKEIAAGFTQKKMKITLLLLDESSYKQALEDGYKAEVVELDDDWLSLAENFDISTLKCFCSLSNDAQNVFLTISLREQYADLEITSLATSEESAQKLRLAGATKAIAKLESTAHIIVESLERPIAVNVMDDIVYKDSDLNLQEFSISSSSKLYAMPLEEVMQVCDNYELIVLTVCNQNKEIYFTFSTEAQNLTLVDDSVLVVMGKIENINRFESEAL